MKLKKKKRGSTCKFIANTGAEKSRVMESSVAQRQGGAKVVTSADIINIFEAL